jgi:DNA-directed RNA polymerase specialized sigma subunit
VEPRHGIDINQHLDLVRIVVASMPRGKWLLSDAVYPQVFSEAWLAMSDALNHFEPSKGSPGIPIEQSFRTFAGDYIRGRVLRWQVLRRKEQAARPFEPLESHHDVAARPRTPGDYMGVASDPREVEELLQILREEIDKLPDRLRDVLLRAWLG